MRIGDWISDVVSSDLPPVDEKWFIPGDFDTSTFLATAKTQFREIQAVWDSGDLDKLRDYITDDLIAEVKPEIVAREDKNDTEDVLLNAQRSDARRVGKECDGKRKSWVCASL